MIVRESLSLNKIVSMVVNQIQGKEKKESFLRLVNGSVDLHAKNNKNFKSKDLAQYQIQLLAKSYGVTLEIR